jgi:RNA polymerase-binding transcription factor DksA
MPDYSQVKSQLEKHLSELAGRVAGVERELGEPMSADFEDQAVEAEDDDVLASQDAALHREIEAIRAAIRRIDLGTYQNCSRCGATIGPARLAVMPTTSLCIDCARASAA